jgi:circadian clock protein KaiC
MKIPEQILHKTSVPNLEKNPTGIDGLDQITGGGLPKGRPTLVCGAAGCGKTLLAMEFLVHGAVRYNEPGVFMAFEETEAELAKNVASLGFDLGTLKAKEKLALDHVHIERSEIEETGAFDLEGLFIRLGAAIDEVGAKRVAIDTVEALFAGLPNEMILRAELRRLFRWLKEKGVTAIITGERGRESLTRYGLEEYVADCVITLDHRVYDQVSTRRLRVVKYRGSAHGTNEYPFLIGSEGISVLPITSLDLNHTASDERVSTGVPRLDALLGGKGYFRGSSVLISGTAGTGKSSLAAAFVDAAARRGVKALYCAFEESKSQIIRNMSSIGFDLGPWEKKGLLSFHAVRPTLQGLEMHLLELHDTVRRFQPQVVVIDPVTNLMSVGTQAEVKSMLTRIVDYFKTKGITAVFTSLISGSAPDQSEVGVSSLMDTWLLLANIESNGERNRALYILKSRGMAHSNQVREFVLSDKGIELLDVYTGTGAVLTGSARIAQQAKDQAETVSLKEKTERRKRQIDREREVIEAQVVALRANLDSKIEEIQIELSQDNQRQAAANKIAEDVAAKRWADEPLKNKER